MSTFISKNLANSSTQLGVPPPRIVGGYEVSPRFKYPALVTIQRERGHDCGGTLWNGNTVITAAHCSYDPFDNVTVKVHRHDLSKTDKQENGQTYKVLSKIVHPNYVGDTRKGYDVAIWKLNAPVGERTNVELDDGTLGNSDDILLTGIGWGATETTPSPNALQEVKVPVYNFKQCMQDYAPLEWSITNTETQICAGYPEGQKDTCQGDSGGPLFAIKGGKQILVGITSYGYGCAEPKFPGIYARVSSLKNWILANV